MFRWLLEGLSTQRPGFDPGLVLVRFAVDNVELGHVFLQVLQIFSSQDDSTNAAHLFSSSCCFYRTNPGNLKKINALPDIWTLEIKVILPF